MHTIVLLVGCLAIASHGRRVYAETNQQQMDAAARRTSHTQQSDSASADLTPRKSILAKPVALLQLLLHPAVAFSSGHGAHTQRRNPAGALDIWSNSSVPRMNPLGNHVRSNIPAMNQTDDQHQLPSPEDGLNSEELNVSDTHLRKRCMHLLERLSGLDRGLLASDVDVNAIDDAASELEASPAAGEIDWTNKEFVSMLDGRWRLVYTSAFASGSLGGKRPGPSSGGPVSLGKIFQDIDTSKARLINAIEPVFVDTPGPFPNITVNIGLGHVLELIGKRDVRITSDGAKIQPIDAQSRYPPLDLQTPKIPFAEEVRALLPPKVRDLLWGRDLGATFCVTYLDDEVRITRGDRDELRVFVRDS